MQRIWNLLSHTRTLVIFGFAALAVFLFLAAEQLEVAPVWALLLLVTGIVAWLSVRLYQRRKARRAARQLGEALEQQAAEPAAGSSGGVQRADVAALRQRMLEAITTIKTSKLGQQSGGAALYELPWYMVIGNPAAGKSTAIANSGLQFPFADKDGKIVQGVGGTRNCDWFFTTDGILLDTAGRYSVYEDDRHEWFSFLGLLKHHRKQAPINGIVIAASIADLTGNHPEFAVNLAKKLRQRVQELTERLEVFAPVYVVFTKADLITGFTEFFLDTGRSERDRVWGATLAYDRKRSGQEVTSFFVERFDELYDGLKAMSLATMSIKRGENLAPGVLNFPLEFSSVKGVLRSFIATLFEENPFQFKPVFRGFYFTSALQEGATLSTSSQRIADRFGLTLEHKQKRDVFSRDGFFLHDLFKQVIFPDKQLVAQYTSRTKIRLRYAAFFGTIALLGALLGGWSWSYMGNRQLLSNVQADMDKAIRLQDQRLDLQSRFEALEILQDRIEQLDRYRHDRPLSVGLGLYQGELLERKLREEYFAGIKDLMLKPVLSGIETYLTEVNARSGKLEPVLRPVPAADSATPGTNALRTYKDSSATSVEDAYNALKTYLMLADRSHAESSHLSDQLTRFWRGWLEANRGSMPREQMIRSAERLISFSLDHIHEPSWPQADQKLTLIDQTRENLRRVVRGMPARERVYADVKARAATRFATMTVARIVGDKDRELVMGSYAIPGTFTRAAWEKFIRDAFKEAASKELQSADWVLKTTSRDDLTLEGSPEQIQKALVAQYKGEYAREWQKFLQGVSIAELRNLDDATLAMNRLGDPITSPLNTVINAVYNETSWDNASLVDAGLAQASTGFTGWFKETILRRAPAPVPTRLDTDAAIPMGPVGQEFAGVARLVVSKDKGGSLMSAYMENLSRLRTRLNTIKNQGDTGPGAKQLMQQTLEGSGSELSDALKFVDEEMLPGLNEQQKSSLRPLLVRPLVQGFNALIQPTEGEVNKIWRAQVYEPFQNNLVAKYPFSPGSKIEANSGEIGMVFGENGAIAKFVTTAMGPLVVRRGDTLSPRKWADMGITLVPAITTSFADWISAPAGTGGVTGASTAGAGGGGSEGQTVFQIQPQPAPGTLEYLKKAVRLVSESEPRDSLVCMPVVRLRRSSTSGFECDPDFVPPSLSVQAAPLLFLRLRRLMDALQAKVSALYGHHREPSKSVVEFRSGDVTSFWLLHAASTAYASLSHYLNHPMQHPERLYEQLLALAGSLMTFSRSLVLADLPPYDHRDPGPAFTRLDGIIRELLDTVISSRYFAVALNESKPSYHMGMLDSGKIDEKTNFYLAVNADLPAIELVDVVPLRFKIGAPDDVEQFVLAALPGVKLVHSPQVPTALPVRPDTYYFTLESKGPMYERMLQAQSICIYVPAGIRELKLELLAVTQ